jgi:retron-type reverse transcriptase
MQEIRKGLVDDLAEKCKKYGSEGVKEFFRENAEKLNDLKEKESRIRGFPQGAAISPLLSILSLTRPNKSPLPKGVEIVMYADDGIVYSDRPFTEEVVREYFGGYGIELSPEKSH